MKKLISNSCLADFEDKDFCDFCENIAELLIEGNMVCRRCSKSLKKLKPQKTEEEEN